MMKPEVRISSRLWQRSWQHAQCTQQALTSKCNNAQGFTDVLLPGRTMIPVLILTTNEARDLPGYLHSVVWCDDVHVFDSLSTDRTVQIARARH